jgi:hypothetical protein
MNAELGMLNAELGKKNSEFRIQNPELIFYDIDLGEREEVYNEQNIFNGYNINVPGFINRSGQRTDFVW